MNRKLKRVIFTACSLIAVGGLTGGIYNSLGKTVPAAAIDKVEESITIEDLSGGVVGSFMDSELKADPIEVSTIAIQGIEYSIFNKNGSVKEYEEKNFPMFNKKYSDVDGVLTFRGDNLRTSPAFGVANIREMKLKEEWSMETSSSSWGGGAGWTGQPSIIKWPEEVKGIMNLKDEYKNKVDFTEVVYASLDGRIYFLDLQTGRRTREPINIYNPIKGSVALDPRGYPLLYVGQGISESGRIGYRIFSLIDGKELYFIEGIDKTAYRGWGAFDSAPIIDKEKDTMLLAGENGLFYNIKLNTVFNKEKKTINIAPEVTKYRYKISGNSYQGIENSIAAYKNLAYFADNGGSVQCLNLKTMKPVWTFNNGDDTDSTITIEVKGDIPYIYTANEVDKQGSKGKAYLRKIDGITGKLVFEEAYEAMSLLGEHPVNGGVLATNVIGKKDLSNLVIFNVARYKEFNAGLIVALNSETGEEAWKLEIPNYCWSSPVDVYDSRGKGYLIQGDSIGNLYLIEGKSGKILNTINLGSNIESSPAVFNNTIVLATRGGKIFGIRVE